MFIRNLLLLMLFATQAPAAELRDQILSIRSLGMGGVYGPVVRDSEALFFNPAALGKVDGLNFQIAELGLGVNGLEAYEDIEKIQNYQDVSDLEQFMGRKYWIGINGKTSFVMPYFGVGLYDSGYMSFMLNNPILPEFQAEFVKDVGTIVGGAIKMGSSSYFGMSLKQIQRTGGAKTVGATTLADTDRIKALADEFQDKGVGYGVDLALVHDIPVPLNPSLSVVWQDVGSTAFRKTAGTVGPSRVQDNLSIGLGTEVDLPGLDWTTGIEYRHSNNNDHDVGKKIHLGTEISLPLINLRAGVNQGYATYGAGIDFLFIELDAAYYDVELGEYAGDTRQNRIMVGLNISLSFDANFNYHGSDGKRRKLKQRR